MWLLHQASFAKPHRAAFKNDYCILRGVEAGSWPEKRLPPRHLQDSGQLHMCYYRNESILYCLTQAYSLFTYWKKEKKKKKSINQEKCYPTKAITATEDFFSFTDTKDDGILKWLTKEISNDFSNFPLIFQRKTWT